MQPLQPPNTHHLVAAQGWMELGNQTSALILKQNGDEIARIVNPEKLEEIIDLLTRAISGEAKRGNYPHH